MTPDQIRIVEWLKEEVPTLYPAFEKAVQLMEGGIFRDDPILCVMRAGTSAR
jgi:hypothetical protein